MSGSSKKQAAQKARLEREAAERAAAERSKRLKLLGGAGGVVVVVVVLVLALGVFKSDPADKSKKVNGVRGVTEAAALIRGLPQNGTTLGNPNAPVTILEIADLKCPGCKQHEVTVQNDIVDKLVRTGKANLEMQLVNYRDQAAGTTDGAAARRAAYNLATTNHFWSFVHTLYYNQGDELETWATDAELKKIAAQAPGLRGVAINTRETPATRTDIAAADKLATDLKNQATPTIYVKPRGTQEYTPVGSSDDVGAITSAVEKASKDAKGTTPSR